MWALSCLSGWVNKATSNIVPFTERHPLSQPVRAASSPEGGAEGASRRGLYHPSRYWRKSGVAGGFYPPLQVVCKKCSCLNVFIDFCEHLLYNIFILQVPPMHRSERNLDVRVGIMPTIHPIYRRNNLENNLPSNKINPENNRLFLKNKPTIAITKARATAKTIAKAITKENLSSCQADKPPRERSFLFLDKTGDGSCQGAGMCKRVLCDTLGTPPQLRIRSAAPPEVEPRALRAGRVRSSGYELKSGVTGGCYPPLRFEWGSWFHSSNHTVDVQTPPVSLTLNHLPFQGRQGRYAPGISFSPGLLQRFCHEP